MTLIQTTTNGNGATTAITAVASPVAPENPFDDLCQWGHDWTFTPPLSRVEIENWQKRFDAAFGKNKNNESCFKLVWSGDRRYWHKYFYDWDAYGKGTKVEERPRVLWKKVNVGNGDYVDLFPPRWLILSRLEPEQYAEQWKLESWVWDPKMGPLVKDPFCAVCNTELNFLKSACDGCGLDIEYATQKRPSGLNKQIRDDEPPKVFWETFEVIGEHDEYCCDVFQGECFGAFRNPQEKDLIRLGELKREFEKRDQSPYEKLNEKTEASIAGFVRDYYRQQYTKMPASTELVIENADSFLAPLLNFTGENFTDREKKEIVKNALNRHYNEKAEQYEQTLRD